MAVVTNAPEFAKPVSTRRDAACRWAGAERDEVRGIRLLGGLMMWVTSLYCAPRKGWFGRTN